MGEPSVQSTDCYFSLTDIKGFTSTCKRKVIYPDIPFTRGSILNNVLSMNHNIAYTKLNNKILGYDSASNPPFEKNVHCMFTH